MEYVCLRLFKKPFRIIEKRTRKITYRIKLLKVRRYCGISQKNSFEVNRAKNSGRKSVVIKSKAHVVITKMKKNVTKRSNRQRIMSDFRKLSGSVGSRQERSRPCFPLLQVILRLVLDFDASQI